MRYPELAGNRYQKIQELIRTLQIYTIELIEFFKTLKLI